MCSDDYYEEDESSEEEESYEKSSYYYEYTDTYLTATEPDEQTPVESATIEEQITEISHPL